MPGAIDHDRISALIEPVVTDKGYDVEELSVVATGPENLVKLVVDRDGGASLDELAELSRSISVILDGTDEETGAQHEDVLAALPTYTLEVTSPGVDRPLTLPRHWRRAAGRKVVVDLLADPPERLAGRIGALDEDQSGVALVTKTSKGFATTKVALASVRKAFVQVDFGEPGAAELEVCGLDPEQIEARRKGNK
ncbi:ribosome maturation factor RimP [Williamsia sp.]|uniref:ribosome maturation factor RimP n=1 Tax=Williamsia sp. TaxID=1872085 RepID=UPI002F91DB5F